MQLFSGVITIVSAPVEVDTSTWSFEANFKNNDGLLIDDISTNDIVFLNGYDKTHDKSHFCRYIVTDIKEGTRLGQKLVTVKMTVKLSDEMLQSGVIYAPHDSEENRLGLLGRKTSEDGFVPLPSIADGATPTDIVKARNIDFEYRDKELMRTIKNELNKLRDTEFIVTDWKPHTAYRKDKLLTYNGMLLQTKQNHVSEENINFTDYNILTSLIFDYNKEFEYRANSIIKVNDVFYIAKKDVPKNIELNNYEYWSKLTGNINLSQWQPNQKYMIGDIVVVDSNIYRAKENHSSESFITNKWDKLTNNMHPFV